MSLPSLLWLLPIVFMLHDFEEIIMMKAWISRESDRLQYRFPRAAALAFSSTGNLSTAAFALGVAGLFIMLSILTWASVEHALYDFWAGILVVFFLHLILHLFQAVIYRGYVPVFFTSLLASVYCVYALQALYAGGYLKWNAVVVWAVLVAGLLVPYFILILHLAQRFDAWLSQWQGS